MNALLTIFQYHFRGNRERHCTRRVAPRHSSHSFWGCEPPHPHANQPPLNPAQTLPHSTVRTPERVSKLDMLGSAGAAIPRPAAPCHHAQSSGRHNCRNMRRNGDLAGLGSSAVPCDFPALAPTRRHAAGVCIRFSAVMPYFFSASALAYGLRAQVCSVETAAAAALPNGGVTEIVIEANVLRGASHNPQTSLRPGASFPATFHSKQPKGDRADPSRGAVRSRKVTRHENRPS